MQFFQKVQITGGRQITINFNNRIIFVLGNKIPFKCVFSISARLKMHTVMHNTIY